MTFTSKIRYPRTANPVSLTIREVAAAYNFPLTKASGKGYTAGLIELGGGFSTKQVDAYFTANNLPVPTIVSVPVTGGSNASDGPNGADGEVQSDILVTGAVAPNSTIRVYFAPNTNDGFLAAIKQALAECNGVSCSWGDAETNWDSATMDAYETVIAEARRRGVPFLVAAGDSGSKDSTGRNVTDFPASSPSSIGCGGTRLEIDGAGARASETVWDDNPTSSATGGGVSGQFPGRDVPDIAGNADPNSGYEVSIDGQPMVIGGTSLVAPLALGLHALLWELSGDTAFDMMNLITTNPQACYDVTAGSNGGFRAGPGRDETTGFGVPDGTLLLAALTSGIAPPVPPAPPVNPPPAGSPLADFPIKAVDTLLASKHNYNRAEADAVVAIVAWGAAHGLVLA